MRQRASAASHAAPSGASSLPERYAKVVSSGATIPGAGAALYRHIAQRHPAFHIQPRHRRTGVFENLPRSAPHSDLRDQTEDHILGGDARRELPAEIHEGPLRPVLQQALGRQHLFHLAGADPEGQRSERAVGGRVAVAAHDRHAGLGRAHFRPDDVDDAPSRVVHLHAADAELAAVGFQLMQLLDRGVVRARQGQARGRDRVIHRRQSPVRAVDFPAARAQIRERLRRCHLVHQLQVDVQHGRMARFLPDEMVVPDFIEQGGRLAHDPFSDVYLWPPKIA